MDTGDSSVQQAIEKVEYSYNLRETFFCRRHQEKLNLIRRSIKEAWHSIQAIPDPVTQKQKAFRYYLEGKALDSGTEYSSEAEQRLTRSVKLNPADTAAWNCLGQCLWKKGQLRLAEQCFQESLLVQRNPCALRDLSMLLRRFESGDEAQQSVKLAKEAVAMDVHDGKSWYFLGNAYLAHFFQDSHQISDLHLALKAYAQASTAAASASQNPDMHYNRAIVLKYLEQYREALDAFDQAGAIDSSMDVQQQKHYIWSLLDRCTVATCCKSNFKSKRLQERSEELPTSGDCQGRQITPLTGLNVGGNKGRALAGFVLSQLPLEQDEKLGFSMLLSEQDMVILCLFNISQTVQLINTQITVLDPFLIQQSNRDQSFTSIRVEQPSLCLLNGVALPSSAFAHSVLHIEHK